MSERPRIVTAWLIGVLALVALDMRWTLWGIADGDPVKLQTGLERQACESLVDVATRVVSEGQPFVEIEWHITLSKGPKAFAVAPMPRYGSARVVRLGSASGAPPSTRGPHRSIRTPGRSGKTNFLLRFWRTAQTISGSRRTKSCRVWCGISRSSGPLARIRSPRPLDVSRQATQPTPTDGRLSERRETHVAPIDRASARRPRQLCLQQLHGPSVRSFGRKH